MREIKLRKHTLKLYDSIDEMPIVNFQKYNKYILIDSGLGSDIDAVDSHLVNLAKLIKTDKAKASQELQNLRQTMHLIVSGISPKYLAFASLIHSVNGERVTDLSDANLKATLDKINEIKHSTVVKFLLWLKKKLDTELCTYFPKFFGDSAKEKTIYDKLKQKALYSLDGILNDIDNSEHINGIDCFLFNLYKPKCFDGVQSIEIKYDKQFESSCVLIGQKTNLDAKKMSALEFYATLENVVNQIEAENKAYKRNKK